MDNTWGPLMWEVTAMLKIRKTYPQLQFARVDYCMYSSPHFKPKAFVTNAPWAIATAAQCDMATRPHHHEPLVGKRGVYKDGERVGTAWTTRGAADYPQGWCEACARHLAAWVGERGQLTMETMNVGTASSVRETELPHGEFIKRGRCGNKLIRTSIATDKELNDVPASPPEGTRVRGERR